MKKRTRVVIRVNDSDGSSLVGPTNEGVEFKILPDTSAQIEAGKRYLMYITKIYRTNVGAGGALNDISAIVIEGLSTDSNNLNLNSNIQKLPVVGIFNLTKAGTNGTDLVTQVIWENPHPKEDGIICSNPFNKRLVIKELNLKTGFYESFTNRDYVFELMIEEICNC